MGCLFSVLELLCVPVSLGAATQLHRSQPCPTSPGARTRSAEVPPDLTCTSASGEVAANPLDCRATRTLHAHVGFPPYPPAYGLWGGGREEGGSLDLGLTALRLRNMTKDWPRTFLSSLGCGYNFLRSR